MDKETIFKEDVLRNSVLLSLIKKVLLGYEHIEQSLDIIYNDSQIHRLTNALYNMLRVCVRYSFLRRIAQMWEGEKRNISKGSQFLQWLINSYKVWKYKITDYLNVSQVIKSAPEIRERFYNEPLKAVGIIIIFAILSNISISIILNKKIGLWGGFLFTMLLLVGLAGLFSDTDWIAIKSNSLILRKIQES